MTTKTGIRHAKERQKMVIFEENVVFSADELVLGIGHDGIMQYVDAFYALNRGWEEKLTLVQQKSKVIFSKSKTSKKQAGDNTYSLEASTARFTLSGTSFDYMMDVLMRFYHFKTLQFDHIHIECRDVKQHTAFDLTLVF